MPFISFIYRIGTKKYFGKYASQSISDDHDGLDCEVRYFLMEGLNRFRAQRGEAALSDADVLIGVLSFSANQYIDVWSSEEEIKCFDFYFLQFHSGNRRSETYVNGEMLQDAKHSVPSSDAAALISEKPAE